MVSTRTPRCPFVLLSAALALTLAAGCTRSPVAPDQALSASRPGGSTGDAGGHVWTLASARTFRLPTLATNTRDPQLPGRRAIIGFSGSPGPDGRTLTADDEPFGNADFYGRGGYRLIDQEYAEVGVHFAGTCTPTEIGGGFQPDGSPAGTNAVLIDVEPNFTGHVEPVTVTFDRSQKAVTFDLFVIVNLLSPSVPITLRDARGNILRQFDLTNADAIIGGDLPHLSGRYLVTAPKAFTSMELGLTTGGGGWMLDNLNFIPHFAVPGPALVAGEGR